MKCLTERCSHGRSSKKLPRALAPFWLYLVSPLGFVKGPGTLQLLTRAARGSRAGNCSSSRRRWRDEPSRPINCARGATRRKASSAAGLLSRSSLRESWGWSVTRASAQFRKDKRDIPNLLVRDHFLLVCSLWSDDRESYKVDFLISQRWGKIPSINMLNVLQKNNRPKVCQPHEDKVRKWFTNNVCTWLYMRKPVFQTSFVNLNPQTSSLWNV